jgi:predicted CoA-binding protein
MTSQATILDFLSQRKLAFAGISRSSQKFSHTAYKLLKQCGYILFPINPHADSIEGDHCFHSVKELPERVDGIIVMTPPYQTKQVIQDAAEAGIRRVWIQQGAETTAAIQYCEQYEISEIHGCCILMFAEPVQSFHKFHRWAWKLMGKMPPKNIPTKEETPFID